MPFRPLARIQLFAEDPIGEERQHERPAHAHCSVPWGVYESNR